MTGRARRNNKLYASEHGDVRVKGVTEADDFASIDALRADTDGLSKLVRKHRNCLLCGAKFFSTSSSHRLCGCQAYENYYDFSDKGFI